MKARDFITWRIMILLFALLISLIAINPSLGDVEGVAIKSVAINSTAASIGISNPDENILPRNREIIIDVNGEKIIDANDYVSAISKIEPGQTVRIETNKRQYDPFLKDSKDLGIAIEAAAKNNLRKGLDLAGGTRVLLVPVEEVNDQDLANARDTISNRLNVFGLSDINVKIANDLSGGKYIVVEVAGATKEDVRELVGKQGKFEAKIGDEVVFIGGERDITFVCRNNAECAGIRQCDPSGDGYSCRFDFAISLSQSAAKRQAEATKGLDVNISQGDYLSKTLDLYLDDKLVDKLQISSSLKGVETTQILISGPGIGQLEEDALNDALKNMNKLQAILITGSLPFKLEIVRLDSISPKLGSEFVKNALFTGIIAAIIVSAIVYIRYRRLKIALPIIGTILSEIFLLLGFAAIIKYNIDIATIAGIIASVGTGVNDQIVITDEVLKGAVVQSNWKERIKRAFFIIFSAYAATVVAMLPLLWAGAGLLTGFAVSTIAGVSIGVLITRPAFASVIEKLLKE